MEQGKDFNEDHMRLLSEELAQIEKKTASTTGVNGTDPKLPAVPEMTLSYVPKHKSPALHVNGTTLIHRGEILVLLAAPGVGKTTITGGIMAAFIADSHNLDGVDSFSFTVKSIGGKGLLLDTERTPDDCSITYQDIFKRVNKNPVVLSTDGTKIEKLTHLILSELDDQSKLRKVLEAYLSTGEYEFVILDGILDFCLSMLDDKDATKVVKWVRALAVKYNCAFVVTIHPNKGTDNPAGHIGAFLYRWSRAFLLIRNTSDKSIKELTTDFQFGKLSHGNMAAFEPVYFGWDESRAMMATCDAPAPPMYKINFLKQAVFDLRMKGFNEIPSATLKEHYGSLAGIGAEAAKKHIARAVDDGLLSTSGKGRSVKYIPASDWQVSGIRESGTDAPYIYTGAIPDTSGIDTQYPNNTRLADKGYPKEWN